MVRSQQLINPLELQKQKQRQLITVFKTAIFKSDISDHFPICFLVPLPATQRGN